MLASRGIDPARIQAMGRWRSPMVLHYATAALGKGLAALVEHHIPSVAPRTDAAAETAALRRQTACLERRLSLLEALEPAPPPPISAMPSAIIENSDSKALHRQSVKNKNKTYCGWKWPKREHRFFADFSLIPADTKWLSICAYCLPAERRAACAKQFETEVSDSE